MKVQVLTVEWDGDRIDVAVFKSLEEAQREALLILLDITEDGNSISEGQEWWDMHPLTRSEISGMTSEEIKAWLDGLHERATVPWISFWERELKA